MASTLDPKMQEAIYPTQWTSTNPGGDPNGRVYMYRSQDDMPPPPMGQRTTGTTNGVEVSVPHQPYEKWIKRCGTVACIPMHTTRIPEKGRDWREDPYYKQTEREQLRAGAVHYETGRRLERGRMVEPERSDWIAEREKFIGDRQAKQSKFREEIDQKWLSEKEAKMAELGESFVTMMKTATERAERTSAETKAHKGK
jgi:hypothetical protein